MNRVEYIGRLTRDPELKKAKATDNVYVRFSLAINRPKKKGKNMGADFPQIIVFNKAAENLINYVQRGDLIGVEGSTRTNSYEGENGKTIYTTECVATRIEFLSLKGKTAPDDHIDALPEGEPVDFMEIETDEDVVPF